MSSTGSAYFGSNIYNELDIRVQNLTVDGTGVINKLFANSVYVSGETVVVGSQTLQIENGVIETGIGQISDTLCLGISGQYNISGVINYAGLVRIPGGSNSTLKDSFVLFHNGSDPGNKDIGFSYNLASLSLDQLTAASITTGTGTISGGSGQFTSITTLYNNGSGSFYGTAVAGTTDTFGLLTAHAGISTSGLDVQTGSTTLQALDTYGLATFYDGLDVQTGSTTLQTLDTFGLLTAHQGILTADVNCTTLEASDLATFNNGVKMGIGDLTFESGAGGITILGAGGIDLIGAGDITITAGALTLGAGDIDVLAGDLGVQAGGLTVGPKTLIAGPGNAYISNKLIVGQPGGTVTDGTYTAITGQVIINQNAGEIQCDYVYTDSELRVGKEAALGSNATTSSTTIYGGITSSQGNIVFGGTSDPITNTFIVNSGITNIATEKTTDAYVTIGTGSTTSAQALIPYTVTNLMGEVNFGSPALNFDNVYCYSQFIYKPNSVNPDGNVALWQGLFAAGPASLSFIGVPSTSTSTTSTTHSFVATTPATPAAATVDSLRFPVSVNPTFESAEVLGTDATGMVIAKLLFETPLNDPTVTVQPPAVGLPNVEYPIPVKDPSGVLNLPPGMTYNPSNTTITLPNVNVTGTGNFNSINLLQAGVETAIATVISSTISSSINSALSTAGSAGNDVSNALSSFVDDSFGIAKDVVSGFDSSGNPTSTTQAQFNYPTKFLKNFQVGDTDILINEQVTSTFYGPFTIGKLDPDNPPVNIYGPVTIGAYSTVDQMNYPEPFTADVTTASFQMTDKFQANSFQITAPYSSTSSSSSTDTTSNITTTTSTSVNYSESLSFGSTFGYQPGYNTVVTTTVGTNPSTNTTTSTAGLINLNDNTYVGGALSYKSVINSPHLYNGGAQFDQYGNILLPRANSSNNWSIGTSTSNVSLQIYPTLHKVSTYNNTLDDGSGNAVVNGNLSCKSLTVNGTQQTITGTTIQLEQGVVELLQGNTADTQTSGFAAQYIPSGSSTTQYSGIVRMPASAGSNEYPGQLVCFQSATDPGASNSTTAWTFTLEDMALRNLTAGGTISATGDITTQGVYNINNLGTSSTIGLISGAAVGTDYFYTSIKNDLVIRNSVGSNILIGNGSAYPQLVINSTGKVTTYKNMMDDGTGNMSVLKGITINGASKQFLSTLATLADVTTTTPQTNQVLTYNGTNWVNQALPATTSNSTYLFSGLGDVTITSPAQYQTVSYNGSKWVNSVARYSSTAENGWLYFGALSAVSGAAPLAAGQLKFDYTNGQQWYDYNNGTTWLHQPGAKANSLQVGANVLNDGSDNLAVKGNIGIPYGQGLTTGTQYAGGQNRYMDVQYLNGVDTLCLYVPGSNNPNQAPIAHAKIDSNGNTTITGTLTTSGNVSVGNDLFVQGTDFVLGSSGTGRGAGGRAMVQDTNNTLHINYANDFSGGVVIDGSLVVNGSISQQYGYVNQGNTTINGWGISFLHLGPSQTGYVSFAGPGYPPTGWAMDIYSEVNQYIYFNTCAGIKGVNTTSSGGGIDVQIYVNRMMRCRSDNTGNIFIGLSST